MRLLPYALRLAADYSLRDGALAGPSRFGLSECPKHAAAMSTTERRTVVVAGATGLQGGAVARHLLAEGWHVRALTRRPTSKPAAVLAALGAEVVQGDMGDPVSLRPVFEGAYGVYSVQNPYIGGMAGEIKQGKNVADVVKQAGIQHLVYGSAGVGVRGTGIPSWESKLEVEEHMQRLGIPLTILRPTAFMELMTERKFFPAISTWHVMPALMGATRKLPWLCVDDLGAIAAKAFAQPDQFIGKAFKLASDLQSIDECRSIYRGVMAKSPPRFSIPIWLFERMGFVGTDLSTMWRWLRAGSVDADPDATRAIHPAALRVVDWLSTRKAAREGTR